MKTGDKLFSTRSRDGRAQDKGMASGIINLASGIWALVPISVRRVKYYSFPRCHSVELKVNLGNTEPHLGTLSAIRSTGCHLFASPQVLSRPVGPPVVQRLGFTVISGLLQRLHHQTKLL